MQSAAVMMMQKAKLCIRMLSRLHNPLSRYQQCMISPLIHRKWCHKDFRNPAENELFTPARSRIPKMTDPGTNKILELTTVSDVYEHFEQRKEEFTASHLHATFSTLHSLSKFNPAITNDIVTHTSFTRLCNRTLKHIRQYDCYETVNLLGHLIFFRVNLSSNIGQATLQMLRHYINEIELTQLLFLDMLLEKDIGMSYDPLVTALKKAIPLLIETQLPYQLNPKKVTDVVNCFTIAAKNNFWLPTIQSLVSLLLHKEKELSLNEVLHIGSRLHYIKSFTSEFVNLANLVISRVTQSCSEFTPVQMKVLFYSLQKCKHLKNFDLFNILSHKCVSECWDLNRTSYLLSVFTLHDYLSVEFLDWTVECLKRDPSCLWTEKHLAIGLFFQAFSEANYCIDRKMFCDLVKKCGSKLDELAEKAPWWLVKLAFNLAVLECIPPELLELVFRPDIISRSLKQDLQETSNDLEPLLKSKEVLQWYLILEQCARLEPPLGYKGPFLPTDLVRQAIKERADVVKPVDLDLKDFLEIGLGPQFLLSGLWTKMGHFIDHLIVMKSEDFPVDESKVRSPLKAVPGDDGLHFIEDIVLPDDAKVVAILVAREEWFNKYQPKMRGWVSFHQRTLTIMGYNPIIIGPPKTTCKDKEAINIRMENGNA